MKKKKTYYQRLKKKKIQVQVWPVRRIIDVVQIFINMHISKSTSFQYLGRFSFSPTIM